MVHFGNSWTLIPSLISLLLLYHVCSLVFYGRSTWASNYIKVIANQWYGLSNMVIRSWMGFIYDNESELLKVNSIINCGYPLYIH